MSTYSKHLGVSDKIQAAGFGFKQQFSASQANILKYSGTHVARRDSLLGTK